MDGVQNRSCLRLFVRTNTKKGGSLSCLPVEFPRASGELVVFWFARFLLAWLLFSSRWPLRGHFFLLLPLVKLLLLIMSLLRYLWLRWSCGSVYSVLLARFRT